VRFVVDVLILLVLVGLCYLVFKDGMERAGYEIGAFGGQVSAGWHHEKFQPGAP
jgi:hypothetical protein